MNSKENNNSDHQENGISDFEANKKFITHINQLEKNSEHSIEENFFIPLKKY